MEVSHAKKICRKPDQIHININMLHWSLQFPVIYQTKTDSNYYSKVNVVDIFSFVPWNIHCNSHQIKSRINHWAFSIIEAKGPDPCLCKTTEQSAVCCPTFFISVHLLSAGWRAQAEKGRTSDHNNYQTKIFFCLSAPPSSRWDNIN